VSDDWSGIHVGGLCAAETRLDWRALDALCQGAARVDHTETLSEKVRGEGVRLGALLARAEPDARVTHVMIYDDGEYRACLPISEARDAAVLAHRLDGAPLPAAMGGPVRLLVPTSRNACLSVKRVVRIALLDHAEPDTVPRPTYDLRKP
jgi:DMSO/TMAO reductase YedYZ molybdopterin-dependent catalytic subunit